jgi:hypothetical protein
MVAIQAAAVSLGASIVRVYVQRGDYYFAADTRAGFTDACIHLTSATHLFGEGTVSQPGTIFYFPSGLVGIKTWHQGQTSPVGTGCNADGARVQAIALIGEGLTSSTSIAAHGVFVQTSYVHVDECQISSFGGDGIHISSSAAGAIADSWLVENCQISSCQNGITSSGGSDTNVGHAINANCEANRGWGFYDTSFLSSTYVSCAAEANALGPYYSVSVIPSVFVGCYSEGGGAASHMTTKSWVVGGDHGALFDSESNITGGTNGSVGGGQTFVGRALAQAPSITGGGTDPRLGVAPPISLIGDYWAWQGSITIRVDATGYPGGYDSFGAHHASQIVVVEFSFNGGSTWNAASLAPSGQGYAFSMGATGVSAYLAPYLYSAGNQYQWQCAGGTASYFTAGVGNHPAAYEFGHILPDVANGTTDDQHLHDLGYNPSTGRWELSSYYSWEGVAVLGAGQEISGSRGLPYPGQVLHSALWSGNNTVGLNRIVWQSAETIGTANWISHSQCPVQSYSPGDLILNNGYNGTAGASLYPLGWRVNTVGGYAESKQISVHPTWSAAVTYFVGETIVPATPNGRLYKAIGYTDAFSDGCGITGSSEPTWPAHTVGATVVDGTVIWADAGIVATTGLGSSDSGHILEAFGSESELPILYACSGVGPFSPTNDAIAHRLIILTGSPENAFTITIPAGSSLGWCRTVKNRTGYVATVKGSVSDSVGVALAGGECALLAHDGTYVYRVGASAASSEVYTVSGSYLCDSRTRYDGSKILDCTVFVNELLSGTITLPNPAIAGRTITVADTYGNANAQNIIVQHFSSETINASTSYAISTNRGSVTVRSDGTNWSIIAKV